MILLEDFYTTSALSTSQYGTTEYTASRSVTATRNIGTGTNTMITSSFSSSVSRTDYSTSEADTRRTSGFQLYIQQDYETVYTTNSSLAQTSSTGSTGYTESTTGGSSYTSSVWVAVGATIPPRTAYTLSWTEQDSLGLTRTTFRERSLDGVGTTDTPTTLTIFRTSVLTLATSTTGGWRETGVWVTTMTTEGTSEYVTQSFDSTLTTEGTLSTQTTYSATYANINYKLHRWTLIGEDEMFITVSTFSAPTQIALSAVISDATSSLSFDEVNAYYSTNLSASSSVADSAVVQTPATVIINLNWEQIPGFADTYTLELMRTIGDMSLQSYAAVFPSIYTQTELRQGTTFAPARTIFVTSNFTTSITVFAKTDSQIYTTTIHQLYSSFVTFETDQIYIFGQFFSIGTQDSQSRTISVLGSYSPQLKGRVFDPVFGQREIVGINRYNYPGEIWTSLKGLAVGYAQESYKRPFSNFQIEYAPLPSINCFEDSTGGLWETVNPINSAVPTPQYYQDKKINPAISIRKVSVSPADISNYTFQSQLTKYRRSTQFVRVPNIAETAQVRRKRISQYDSVGSYSWGLSIEYNALPIRGHTTSVNPLHGGITPATFSNGESSQISLLAQKPILLYSVGDNTIELNYTEWTNTTDTVRSETKTESMFVSQQKNFTSNVSINILPDKEDIYINPGYFEPETEIAFTDSHNLLVAIIPRTAGDYAEVQRY
jgi:hypothetical protein